MIVETTSEAEDPDGLLRLASELRGAIEAPFHMLSTPTPVWFPKLGTITVEACRANGYVKGFVQDYFRNHPGARANPARAAQRIKDIYGIDANDVLFHIYRTRE